MNNKLTPALIIFLSAVLLLNSSFKVRTPSKGSPFIDINWGLCKKQAKVLNKPIFVFIGAPYCHISQKMNHIFGQQELGEVLIDNFVCTQMNSEKLMTNVRVSNWGITHVPSYLFFTPKGKLVYKFEGFKDKACMLEEIKCAMAKVNLALKDNSI